MPRRPWTIVLFTMVALIVIGITFVEPAGQKIAALGRGFLFDATLFAVAWKIWLSWARWNAVLDAWSAHQHAWRNRMMNTRNGSK